MALDTVQDYVTASRVLLQDQVEPYRYPDSDFVDALNFALLQSRRYRADLFINVSPVPSFSINNATAVAFDEQYRMALVYAIAGHIQLKDEEDSQDSRAAMFMQKFTGLLLAPGA